MVIDIRHDADDVDGAIAETPDEVDDALFDVSAAAIEVRRAASATPVAIPVGRHADEDDVELWFG